MKTHYLEISRTKTAIIVELEEREIKELEKGNPITVKLKTTFVNNKLLNDEMEKFWQKVEEEHNQEEYNRLTKELEEVRKKLKI
jgi:hypothetical protein